MSQSKNASAALTIVISTVLGCALAYVSGGHELLAFAVLAFAIQWIAFVPAWMYQTEHFYDLTGSLTYATLVIIALLTQSVDTRGLIIGLMVLCWCSRLGWFLFRRVRRDGKDGRFDSIKTHPLRFLVAWTLQGLWVFTTLLAALLAIFSPAAHWDLWATLGALVWLAGFALESVADAQKSAFRAEPGNRGKFIQHGLWRYSRHPNYLGEIMLWSGIALMALPTFSGWQWLGLLSPLFVYVLINHVSGVPILERRAEQSWGEDPDYQAYKARSGALLPRFGPGR